jgi:hypothetical protein
MVSQCPWFEAGLKPVIIDNAAVCVDAPLLCQLNDISTSSRHAERALTRMGQGEKGGHRIHNEDWA